MRYSVLGLGELDDPAEVHHGDAIADVLHDLEVVRDEQVGQPLGVLQILEQVDDLRLDRDVERADRLVAHDELRLDRERARDPDPLALAAGELVRVAARRVVAQPDLREQLVDARIALGGRFGELVDHERLGDRRADRHPRVERRVRVLEDHLHVAAHRAQLALRQPRDVGAVERDRAGARLEQAQDRAAERRLAAARFADEAERLAAPDLEIDLRYRAHRVAGRTCATARHAGSCDQARLGRGDLRREVFRHAASRGRRRSVTRSLRRRIDRKMAAHERRRRAGRAAARRCGTALRGRAAIDELAALRQLAQATAPCP